MFLGQSLELLEVGKTKVINWDAILRSLLHPFRVCQVSRNFWIFNFANLFIHFGSFNNISFNRIDGYRRSATSVS